MTLRTCTILGTVLLLTGAVGFAQAEGGSVISIDEDSLFGSEDDLFSQPLIEDVEESTIDISAILLTSEAVRIGGRYSFGLDASSAWVDITTVPDTFFSPDSMSLTTSLSSQIFFDARPDKDFRVFGKMTASYPFETDTDRDLQDVFHVDELFSDFNWNDTLFFRGGKQAMNWGVGYFFSPADLLSISEIDPEDPEADREGPVGLKVNAPIGINNLYLYALPAFADDFTDIGVAAKIEIVLGGAEIGYGEVLQADIASARMLTLSTSLGDFDVFAEGVMTYGSNRTYVQEDGAAPLGVSTYLRDAEIIFNASAGFLWTESIGDEGSSVVVVGQYLYYGEGYSDPSVISDNQLGVAALLGAGDISVTDLVNIGQHYSGVQASWNDVFGSGFNTGVFWMHNYTDMSARVIPSVSTTILDTIRLTLQVPMAFGGSGDELSPLGNSLSINVGASLGNGSF